MKIKFCYLSNPYATWLIAFFLTVICLYGTGGYHFCYLEQWETFVYDTSYLKDILLQPGGFSRLTAGFLIQFYTCPTVGILFTSFLLSCIFLLISRLLYHWLGNNHLLPCAALPAITVAFLSFNTNFHYSGMVAFLFMLIALTAYIRIQRWISRLVYGWISCILLFFLAGSIVSLYACLVCLFECFHSPKKAVYFLTIPIVTILLGYGSLWAGWVGEWKHALLPDGYFTRMLKAGSSIYLPWGTTLGIFVIAGIYSHFNTPKKGIIHTLLIIQCLFIGCFLWQNTPKYIQGGTETFKEMSYLARHRQWNKLIDLSRELPMNNLLHQNYVNLALAEKGKLVEELTHYPNIGIQSLFINGNKTPYIYALLSDIYFSMGHIAFSQRHAFEANQTMGNFSPYLLQRLVQVSLIFGYDELALKYIRILEKTLFYKEWAQQHRRFIGHPSLLDNDPLLGAKRKCIIPENRFSGSKGLDKDLEDIIRQNPTHTATSQYLNAIYQFIGKPN